MKGDAELDAALALGGTPRVELAHIGKCFARGGEGRLDRRAVELEVEGKDGEHGIADELQDLAAESSADEKFAASIQKFGAVVLGNYFLYTEADLRDIDAAVLDDVRRELAAWVPDDR